MRNRFILIGFFLSCAGLIPGFSQSVYLRSYATAEGLPSPTIYDIASDRRGYLWLVTEAGPVRFDGKNFTVPIHQHQHSKPGSLLTEDRFGRIWYETFDGYLLYIDQDTVHALAQTLPLGYIPFVVDKNYIAYVTPYGVEQVPLTELDQRIRIPMNDFTPDFFFKASDTLVAVQGGRWVISINKSHQSSRNQLGQSLYSQAPIITRGEANEMLVTTKFSNTNRIIYALTSKSYRQVAELSLPHAILVFKFYQNLFWIGTSQGLYIVDKRGQVKRHVPGLYVTSLFHHPNGSVWIGTRNQGLFRLDDLDMRLLTLPEGQFPLTMETLGNKILVGTEQGTIWELDRDLRETPKPVFQAKHEISWIKPLPQKKIAIGSDQFFVLDANYRTHIQVNLAAKDVVELGNKTVGVAATGFFGYFHYGGSQKVWDIKAMATFADKWMSQVRGKWITRDSVNGDLYFAGNMGLFHLKNNQLREVQWQPGQKIFVQNLFSFQGKVWVVTSDFEVRCRENGKWKKSTKLPTPFHRIKEVQGRLFGCSDQQIYEWSGEQWRLIRQVAVHDRLIDFTLLGKTLYCLVNHQVIQFPLHEPAQKVTSTLLVEEPKITQLADGETVEIAYSLIDFERQRGVISYQVNQAPWVELDPRTSQVRLSALAPGTYEIRFRVDEDIRKTLSFVVPTPWYQQPFLWILLFTGTAFLYYGYYRIGLRRVAQANQLIVDKLHLENRLKESRLQLIKAQMNPHFFFNALNTIQSFIATHENKQAEDYLQQFAKLTRMVLDMTDKSVISLAEELTMQKTYLDLQCVRLKDFTYVIELDPAVFPEETYLPTMLLQPYVENALLHGLGHSLRPKKLTLRFQLRGGFLWIEIEDNGIGRAKAAQINQASRRKHRSFATSASLERIALSHQDQLYIEIIDLPEPGTRVLIQIPYPYKYDEGSIN